MKTKKYFMISVLAFLACGCQDEDEAGVVQPTPGEEVQFGAALEQTADTRTIYGEEANNAFPIYWEQDDQVIISSPDCLTGRSSATYRVNVETATQNYASSLEKTGDAGLQWGDASTGDFYSVYPAPYTYTGDNRQYGVEVAADNCTYTLSMPAQQNVKVGDDGVAQSDMRACFMYAATKDVPNGSTVDLKYKPLSAALRFTLQGPQGTENTVIIRSVRIVAPESTNISGTITADLSKATENNLPTLNVGSSRNYVTLNVTNEYGAFLTLTNGEKVELNAFLLITGDTQITSNWYIEVQTLNATYTKHLDGTTDALLKPGMVHRLSALPPFNNEGEWDVSNWMTNIPRNVYLSEISLPGSWNSLNTEYQPDGNGDARSITEQYNMGVRAFHLDTRWRANTNRVGLFDSVNDLGVADGGSTVTVRNGLRDLGKCMTDAAPSFAKCLTEVTNNVKDNEYMVVICTFAQDSYDYTDENGDDWMDAISRECANNNKVIMATDITPNTVVKDVLGKVIVMINTDKTETVPNSKCLFFNMGMTLDQDYYKLHDYYTPLLNYYNSTSSGITLYGTHAQITDEGNGEYDNDRGYMPSLSEREEKAGNILTWSQSNYNPDGQGSHNAWLYIGLGGYVWESRWISGDENLDTVTERLNPWMQGKIDEMDAAESYYPVGIVLMNDVNSYSDLVKDILLLNNKYRQAADPNRSPIDGSDLNSGSSNYVISAAPGYSSGMVDNQTDAIGWTRSR